MDFLKEIFGDKALTFAELEAALKDKNIKLANLSSGQYVDKAKLDAKISELNAANQTIKDLQETVKKFDGVDVQALQKQIADLQAKYDADLSRARLDSAVELTLATRKARNPRLVKAALDMEKIKLDGDTLLGLDEQLEAIKKSDPYLFEEEKPGPTVNSGIGHGNPLDGGNVDKFIAAATAAAGINTNQN